MILHTKFEETIEIQESGILHFEQGLPGFEDETQFVLLPMEGTPFSTLQSVTTKDLAFFTTNPFLFFKEYDFELAETVQEQLKVKEESDVLVQVILTIHETLDRSTANLQAPVVINVKESLAKQVVLTDNRYKTRHELSESLLVGQEG
ncbi:flagellar assembly protein FliW [Fictibacillus phosphorivorans]|uniref:flagellar assembly protein FliW n=1 Tax=Fictibacillus phosphorivorans TaxID=1221500 RepID=UPI00203AC36B|nr:flagellar assembly protein FliW [Fictibacillus phosphorivorans]MCM3718464.1 flagellar assembly protein FliW [Fictibacillus phosphorivorans]MCM3776180.1 flagellar assembly protein FliW [Fictibacillus phosphorivorans]